jgi:hypothetical protein
VVANDRRVSIGRRRPSAVEADLSATVTCYAGGAHHDRSKEPDLRV